MSENTELATRGVAYGLFDAKELKRSGRHLMAGFVDQDETFLDLCAQNGVDPRTSVRIAVARDGSLLAVTAKQASIEKLLHTVRRAPKKIQILFEERPVVDGQLALPDSQSTDEKGTG
jgi:hypothetical protein